MTLVNVFITNIQYEIIIIFFLQFTDPWAFKKTAVISQNSYFSDYLTGIIDIWCDTAEKSLAAVLMPLYVCCKVSAPRTAALIYIYMILQPFL